MKSEAPKAYNEIVFFVDKDFCAKAMFVILRAIAIWRDG